MAHLHAALELLSGDDSVRAKVTRSRLERMLTLTEQLGEMRIQIDALVRASGSTLPRYTASARSLRPPLLARSPTCARYPIRHHFATAIGTAPIPASSGRTVRHSGPAAAGTGLGRLTAAGTAN
jgi:hypothetical protein